MMINAPTNFKTYSKVKKPPIINVIRRKEILEAPSSWWSPEHRYYSGLFNEKQYIYSFLSKEPANKCIEFLEKYKQVNKRYPDIHGMNTKINKCDDFEFSIYIDKETLISLKHRCLVNGVGLIGISYFDYTFIDSFLGQKNVFNLSMSAIDLLEDESVDNIEQIENLNYLFDF
jgi:hypothetical protein